MKIFPDMSTLINTGPVSRSWLTQDIIQQLDGAPVLCKITFTDREEESKTRLFYDLKGSPFISDELNTMLAKLKTSVAYPNDKITTMIEKFSWVKKITGNEVFCKFVWHDNKVATSCLALPAQQKKSA